MSKEATIEELQQEIKRLTDENESLWLMLDEIRESNIANYQDLLKKSIEKKLEDLKEQRAKMPKTISEA